MQDEPPSHKPSEWTLGANCALAAAMETLGWRHITLSRISTAAPSYKIANCSQKENILYMANTINAMDVGMEVPVNCQAVINKLRNVQTVFGSDADGLLRWKVKMQEQKFEESRIRA
jgi:hypothetical protein